jgi:hypothetical protein
MTRHKFHPEPEINKDTRTTAVSMLAYPSSVPGAFSVAFDADGSGLYHRGLRLTRDQAATLRDELTNWLGAK